MAKKIIIFFFVLFVSGCSKKPLPPFSQKPKILTSIAPYCLLIEQIATDDFQVQTLVPKKTDPHSYEPTANEVFELNQALIWFKIGEPFEKKILQILTKNNPNLIVKDLRHQIPLTKLKHICENSSENQMDRHFWLSPKIMKQQAHLIEKTLSENFPEKSALFQRNLNILLSNLDELDAEVRKQLKDAENRTILVSHPAFGYFCKDYNLKQLSIEFEGKKPRPKQINTILKQVKEQHLNLAITLPQFNNKGTRLIAKRNKIPIHMIDPYEADYIATIQRLTSLIRDSHGD